MTAIYEYCGPRPRPRRQGATLVVGGRYEDIDADDPQMAGLIRTGWLVAVPAVDQAAPAAITTKKERG